MKYLLRRLLAQPGFTTVAILSLALGIGASVAMFSVVYGALLQPLSYPQPARLISVHETIPEFAARFPLAPVETGSFSAWRARAITLAGLALFEPTALDLTGRGEPEHLYAEQVSASMFSVLGVRPRLGRDFFAGDDQPGHVHVVILSDALWRNEFHADPGIIGQTLDLNGRLNQVVGVMAPGFRFPFADELGPIIGEDPDAARPPQLFQPAGVDLAQEHFDNFNYGVFARLKPGVTPARAQAELETLTAAALRAEKAPIPHIGIVVTPLRDQIAGNDTLGLWLLLAAVGAILLIVCLNLSNLMLVRVHGRGHELAIRLALGADRRRLARAVVGEGVALAAAGGGLGVLAAWWAVRALVASAPAGIPRLDQIGIQPLVLLAACGIALASGILFSLGPALRAARSHPQAALRGGGRGASDTAQKLRVRQVLVGAQAALSALLLAVAGMLGASYLRLMGVGAGFQPSHVLTVTTEWTGASAPRRTFLQSALEKLRALPGVEAVGLSDNLPLSGFGQTQIAGLVHDPRPEVQRPLVERRDVSSGYFAALGIPLLEGRDLDAADLAAAAQTKPGSMAAVVSLSMANKFWPGRDPIAQQFVIGERDLNTVVGVAADVHADGLAVAPELTIYVPFTYQVPITAGFALRARTDDPAQLAAAVRAAIWSAQPNATIPAIATMDDLVSSSVGPRRFQLTLVGLFALCGLALAGLGIYGVVAYSVECRAAEIGIRIAMGARTGNLIEMILRQGLTPVLAGLVLGLAAALAAGRLLASLLFGVQATNPAVLAGVAVLLVGVAAGACWIPAQRATRVDPCLTLRQ